VSGGSRRVCVAAFAGAHGVKGEARVKSFTADPADFTAYGPLTAEGGRIFEFQVVREQKPGLFIVRAAQIASREDAAALSGEKLYAPREALPEPDEGEFYYEDLVGLRVEDETGVPLGRVKAVVNYGAGDLIEIIDIPGVKGARLLPFTKDTVPVIDLAAGRVTAAPPEEWP